MRARRPHVRYALCSRCAGRQRQVSARGHDQLPAGRRAHRQRTGVHRPKTRHGGRPAQRHTQEVKPSRGYEEDALPQLSVEERFSRRLLKNPSTKDST